MPAVAWDSQSHLLMIFSLAVTCVDLSSPSFSPSLSFSLTRTTPQTQPTHLCVEDPPPSPPLAKSPPLQPPPPPPGHRHFHVFLVNMNCAGLCCPSALVPHIGTASTRKSLHTCSLCLRQWRVPQFALRYPCNPPPPPGHRHLVTVPPPHPGDRRALPRDFARGGGGYLKGNHAHISFSVQISLSECLFFGHNVASIVPTPLPRSGCCTHSRCRK